MKGIVQRSLVMITVCTALHLGAGDWLYQVSIYALASPIPDPACCLLSPVQCSNERPASVILRHVLLLQLAELLSTDRARGLASERMRYAEERFRPHGKR